MIDWNKHQKMQGTKIKNFEFLKVLGSGSFAVVYEAVDNRDGSIVAIKVLPLKIIKSNYKVEELVQTQIRVLKQISKSKNGNANVLRFIDSFMVSKSIFIVTEYCNGGDLSDYLDTKKRLTEDEATDFLKQILNGFRGLHEANAMHRDFKLANVLIHQGVCKIADLGFAKQLKKDELTKTILGTDLTKAPEVLEELSYGMEADIWSVGVVYYQMLYGVYPYQGYSEKNILNKIKLGSPSFKSVNISAEALDFIKRCLTVEPKQRITWKQIYDHPLIKNDTKAIYGLNSSMQFNDNKNFYQNGGKVLSNFLNIQALEISGFDTIQKTEKIQSDQISGLIKRNEQKKIQDLGLNSYQKAYFSHRNNIMFIFKFVTPYITSLLQLNANPDITLFILAKKAYHEMMQFSRQIEKKQDFLKLNPYFQQFVATPIYKQILQKIKRDCELIRDQVNTYRAGIANCNSNISQQFDLSQIKNPKWLQFVDDIITSYEHQLSEQLDFIEGSVKEEVISVIYALKYYRDHLKNAETQECARKIAELDYEQAEKDIQKFLASQNDDQ